MSKQLMHMGCNPPGIGCQCTNCRLHCRFLRQRRRVHRPPRVTSKELCKHGTTLLLMLEMRCRARSPNDLLNIFLSFLSPYGTTRFSRFQSLQFPSLLLPMSNDFHRMRSRHFPVLTTLLRRRGTEVNELELVRRGRRFLLLWSIFACFWNVGSYRL